MTTTTQPLARARLCAGSPATASVSATGTDISFQWFKGENALNGQTSATLIASNVQASNAGSYNMEITGACNSETSTALVLTVYFLRIGGTPGGSATVSPE